MIKGIAFDLEGTVVNLEPAHHGAHLKVLREMGLDLTLEEAIGLCPHFIGGPHETLMQEIHNAGSRALSLEEISSRDKQYYHELRETMSMQPRPGFSKFLRTVRELGLETAIGSLTDTKNALFILERSGLDKEFHRKMIVLKEDVRELKPAPDVFLETARRMNICPQEQLVFEDSHNGVLAARRAGSLAIGMPVYNQPESIMPIVKNGAARIFMDWREISIPDLLLNLASA